jgi:hypothetical protein
MKEVPNNLDMTTCMLGLTDKEEDQVGLAKPHLKTKAELIDVQKINAVGTEYGR